MADEKWIEWQGGQMPVEPRDYVEVDFGDGSFWDDEARKFDWSAKSDGIIRYRVIPESFRLAQQAMDGVA